MEANRATNLLFLWVVLLAGSQSANFVNSLTKYLFSCGAKLVCSRFPLALFLLDVEAVGEF